MPKTKRASRCRGTEEREAEAAPAVRCTPSAAGAKVFAIENLTETILHEIPETTLLFKFQRVCQGWRAIARRLLQPRLDGVPQSLSKQLGPRQLNPLLLDHFGKILNVGEAQLEIGLWLTGSYHSQRRSLIDLPIAATGPGRVVHTAYARVGASWRNMQMYHPPVHELRYRREPDAEVEAVTVAGGVRLGQVYDLLSAITSDTKGVAWNEVLLTWPQASAGDDDASGGDADSELGEMVDRDYILLERVRHVLPRSCVCTFRPARKDLCYCAYSSRKRELQLITSNKWRVTSKEFREENLLVRI
ncbi:hypothetical protein ISF_06050 [Cordyceps fumosorosea ARSEF 2679]|uniref:F-box domain-containing protein n=1 Tax=Cordyceps fumosorosea (strain ARSEF 2679) TaxID=1081104 RepID=A0A167SXS2_CORFA|nr:hypothetical protein ISF_06050 [Cordyceps fumosorosea ARSEF 2679]OAA60039.1 hypothetical protein ISF_06050 [Cordyceps fumosorosea ARSEF 2679]